MQRSIGGWHSAKGERITDDKEALGELLKEFNGFKAFVCQKFQIQQCARCQAWGQWGKDIIPLPWYPHQDRKGGEGLYRPVCMTCLPDWLENDEYDAETFLDLVVFLWREKHGVCQDAIGAQPLFGNAFKILKLVECPYAGWDLDAHIKLTLRRRMKCALGDAAQGIAQPPKV